MGKREGGRGKGENSHTNKTGCTSAARVVMAKVAMVTYHSRVIEIYNFNVSEQLEQRLIVLLRGRGRGGRGAEGRGRESGGG